MRILPILATQPMKFKVKIPGKGRALACFFLAWSRLVFGGSSVWALERQT